MSVEKQEPVIEYNPNLFGTVDDFVFLDDYDRPYRVRVIESDRWLLYWHADKKWVSLRECSQAEAMRWFLRRALPIKKATLYEAGIPFLRTIS